MGGGARNRYSCRDPRGLGNSQIAEEGAFQVVKLVIFKVLFNMLQDVSQFFSCAFRLWRSCTQADEGPQIAADSFAKIDAFAGQCNNTAVAEAVAVAEATSEAVFLVHY